VNRSILERAAIDPLPFVTRFPPPFQEARAWPKLNTTWFSSAAALQGYNGAIRAGQLGLKVACVEKRGKLGGTCLNVGCIPSKSLLHASEMFELAAKDFAGMGIKVTPELDLPSMMKSKSDSVGQLTKGVEFLFRKNKVEYVQGEGRIAGPAQVAVRGLDGAERTLTAKNIVIATGSEPSSLPGVVVDQKRIVDSTGVLDLPAVPKTMIVIGAGIIGLELGSVWRRLGAKVTVVEYLDRITPGMDEETAKTFQRTLTKQGMIFKLGQKVTGATVSDAGVSLSIEPAKGGAPETLDAEVVLLAVGRRPYTASLGLERSASPPTSAATSRPITSAPARRASGRSATSPTAPCWPTRARTRPSLASS
jgi:dihydrolipoamide dehydrogenase